MKNNYLLLCALFLLFESCNSNLNMQFEKENDKLKADYLIQNKKFIKENSFKLSDSEMLHSLDSIGEEYFIIKNKELAIKYIKSTSGLKRLNFLKKNFSDSELRTYMKDIPTRLKGDTNYLSIIKYIEYHENDTL